MAANALRRTTFVSSASAAVVAVVRDGGRGLEPGGDDLLLLLLALALALRLGAAGVGEAKLVLGRGIAAELHGRERGFVHDVGGGVALPHHRRDRRLLLSLGLLVVVDGHLVDGLLGLGLGRVGVGVAALRRRLRLVAGLAPAALAGAAAVGTLVAGGRATRRDEGKEGDGCGQTPRVSRDASLAPRTPRVKENACFPRVKRRRRAPATRRGAAPERRGAGRTRAPPRDVVCRIGGRGAFRFGRAIRWETAGNAPSAGAVRAVARATFAFAGLAAIGVAGTGAAALGADDLALELARRAGRAGTAGALSTAGGA